MSAVLLMSVVATAGVTNPDGFEGYVLTTDWQPTLPVEGWNLDLMYGVPGGQLASIEPGQFLEINFQGGYGMEGQPMWDADGPADAATAVTTSGFDIKLLSYSFGDNFVARFDRADDTEPWYHSTWEVGFRVGSFGDFTTPHGPAAGTGTYVYLRTWVGPGDEQTIPGPGQVADLVGDGNWYSVEIEEDNVTHQSRARYGVTGGAMGAWTPWASGAHAASSDYAAGGSLGGFLGGQMQFDNFYITPEPATMVLLGAGSLLLIRRKRR